MRIFIDLIDSNGLLKVYQNNPDKLSNAIKFALEDAEYIFRTLQKVAGVDEKDEEDFFVELQCKQGITVTLLVSKATVEFENVACNICNRESRCKNKLQWLINFKIVSPYIEYLWRNGRIQNIDGDWQLKSPSKNIKNINIA